ncbi:MAG: polysaccharide deacetylase family protein [Actinomycetota bacterium]|nr:polysaccharide deacetylase family protein [Actinomycetota bacterium]
MKASTLFTTSWDDGNALDVRVVGLLEGLGLTGTFYASTGEGGVRTLDDDALARIGAAHELGNHGRTHTPFTLLSPRQIEDELEWGKAELTRFGRVAPLVAPPKGKMNDQVTRTLKGLGYGIRAAPLIGTDAQPPGWIEPSFHFFPFRWSELLRNTARRRLLPATPLVMAWARGGAFRDRSVRLLRVAARHLPCVHVWGHSADLERLGLWGALEEVLEAAAALRMSPVTNGQLLEAAGRR